MSAKKPVSNKRLLVGIAATRRRFEKSMRDIQVIRKTRAVPKEWEKLLRDLEVSCEDGIKMLDAAMEALKTSADRS